MKNQKYTVRGSVRGLVSSHRFLRCAIAALERDQRACASQSSGLTRCYSDCVIAHNDGNPLSDSELAEISGQD